MKLPAQYYELTEHELKRHIDRRERMIIITKSEIRALEKMLKQKQDFLKRLHQ